MDIDRLHPEDFMTCLATREEIKEIIRDFKDGNTLGISGINKVLLLNLPDVASDRLKEIINLTMSMEYFSVLIKIGQIILIPKQERIQKTQATTVPSLSSRCQEKFWKS